VADSGGILCPLAENCDIILLRLIIRKVEYLLKGAEGRRRLRVLDAELLSHFAKNAESDNENDT
jgi:hypothetical protein